MFDAARGDRPFAPDRREASLTSLGERVRGVLQGIRASGDTSYTMVVPTYNRARLLSRLLDYLEAEGAWFPLLILDSSAEEIRRHNADRIARSPLEIRHRTYLPDLDPYLKVQDGLRAVDTAYCSLCADDDVVFLPALARCLRVLHRRADVCAAHGIYFNFFDGPSFDLSYVVYRGPSIIADAPLVRLQQLFAAYEAVYYAVYRTHVLQAVFRRVDELHTVLGRELVTAALTTLSGKVIRINEFYYGRSTGDSFPYTDSHPHQLLATAPEALFEEYARLRAVILEHLGGGAEAAERNRTVVDVTFLEYLEPFLRPDVLDLIISDRLQGWDGKATTAHLWSVFARSNHAPNPLTPLIDGRHFTPDRYRDAPYTDYLLTSHPRTGGLRTYRIFHEFLFPTSLPPAAVSEGQLLRTLERLDAY